MITKLINYNIQFESDIEKYISDNCTMPIKRIPLIEFYSNVKRPYICVYEDQIWFDLKKKIFKSKYYKTYTFYSKSDYAKFRDDTQHNKTGYSLFIQENEIKYDYKGIIFGITNLNDIKIYHIISLDSKGGKSITNISEENYSADINLPFSSKEKKYFTYEQLKEIIYNYEQ